MSSSYIVKERTIMGVWQNAYGRGLRYTQWRTIAKFADVADAVKKLRDPKARIGMRQWVIFYKGKKYEHGDTVNTYSRAHHRRWANDRLQEQNMRERTELWEHISNRP